MSSHLTDTERETLLTAVMDWEDHGGEMPTYILPTVERIIDAREAEAKAEVLRDLLVTCPECRGTFEVEDQFEAPGGAS